MFHTESRARLRRGHHGQANNLAPLHTDFFKYLFNSILMTERCGQVVNTPASYL
jgi:hypothetical protein